MSFTPKTRLEKILCGVTATAKTRLEKAVKQAVTNAGGGGGSQGPLIVTLTYENEEWVADVADTDIVAAFQANRTVNLIIGSDTMLPVTGVDAEEGTISASGTGLLEDGDATLLSGITAIHTIGESAWEINAEPGVPVTDCTPFEIAGTFGVNGSSKKTITMDKTAGELYAAVTAGRMCKMTGTDNGMSVEYTMPISTVKFSSGNTSVYQFRVENEEGAAYVSEQIADDATVVLTEE